MKIERDIEELISKYGIEIDSISEDDIDSEQMDKAEWLEYAKEHDLDPNGIVDMERIYEISMMIDKEPVKFKFTFNLHGCWESRDYIYDYDSVWEIEEIFDDVPSIHVKQLAQDEEFQRYICEQYV